VFELPADESAKVLKCRRANANHLVQEAVIQKTANVGDLLTEKSQVDNHACRFVRHARNGNFGLVGMTVNP
jgi:hypothetical protein